MYEVLDHLPDGLLGHPPPHFLHLVQHEPRELHRAGPRVGRRSLGNLRLPTPRVHGDPDADARLVSLPLCSLRMDHPQPGI
jgi:hypothetical protein